MTKQPKLSKAEAIKEIEKLTCMRFQIKFFDKVYYFIPTKLKAGLLKITKNNIELYDDICGKLDIPTEWLEPLSRLIPILFEKEGE